MENNRFILFHKKAPLIRENWEKKKKTTIPIQLAESLSLAYRLEN
jgi:hypothetical protein